MVSKKDKYLASAQKLLERGQLDKALAEYAKVVQEDPKDTRTWLKMAEVHAKRGAHTEATEIYLRTGDLYVEQGFAQKAVAVYKNVLKLSPGTVSAHLKVAALFHQLGLLSDAVQQFELAAAALQASKPTEAVAALKQAVEIQPDNVVLRVKLAESASHAGMVDEAVREFGRAAEQLKAQGRVDESLRVIERLLFHQPDNFDKARALAEAYIARGTPRLALPKLQACLNGDEPDPRTLSLLARALEQLGQVSKAVSVLRELVRLCEEMGRPAERDAAVLRGLTLDPADDELRAVAARHQLRALAAASSDVTPPPISTFRGAARDDGFGFDLGDDALPAPTPVTRSKSGRVVAPVGLADSGASASGGHINRILAEADVFEKYGLLERAADHLRRVFDLDPQERTARERLIAILQRLGLHEEAEREGELLIRAQPPRASGLSSRQHAVSLAPDVGLAPALFDALPEPEPGPFMNMDVVDLDAGDPAADVLTPPPVAWPRLSDSVEQLEVSAASDFAEVRTGDIEVVDPTTSVLDADVEFSIDVSSQDEPSDIGSLTDQGGNTPPLVRTPMVIASPFPTPDTDATSPARDGDDEDPASAFSEDVATITGDPEGVAAAFAALEHDDELSAELEQVSFFLDQAMMEDARSLLKDLESRFPDDARVVAKLRQAQIAERRSSTIHPSDSVATSRIAASPTLGSTFIERPLPADRGTPTPRAVVNDGESSDAATHADLAIAYKGMGLFDAAIAELKLLAQDETQEVFALTTMGECFEAKSSFTEAIIRYKRALNCEQITASETLLLYFLLGAAFEHLGDVSEALYFYEKVLKRDPKFRDVDLKVAELRPRLIKKAR